MYTVLIKYNKWVDPTTECPELFAGMDIGGKFIEKSKIVKVADLIELNDKFESILDVIILEKPKG